MNIFIDGFQNTGKTTLISNSKYNNNRFKFTQYFEKFKLTKSDINGFQLGKDLGILFGLQYNKDDVIFDRGPFSTIYYSLKENRYGKNTINILNDFIDELCNFKNCKYIFVIKKNYKSINRNHNDGFDYLNDDLDIKKDEYFNLMLELIKNKNIELIIFENDFSKSIEYNQIKFNKLLKEIK